MIRVLSIDPGLDGLGLAVFEAPDLATFDRALQHQRVPLLAATEVVHTDAGDPLVERLALIADSLTTAVGDHGITHALLELPAKDGAYRERQARQRTKGDPTAASMAGLNRAIGATVAGLARAMDPRAIVTARASRIPKKARHAFARQLLLRSKWEKVHNSDLLCAVWLGLSANLDLGEQAVAR